MRTGPLSISEEEAKAKLAHARQLVTEGRNWKVIARLVGISEDWLKRRLVPGYAEARAASARRHRERGPAPTDKIRHRNETGRVSLEEAEAARAAVPDDTRNYTSRFFGDPLPGRSALDRRGAA